MKNQLGGEAGEVQLPTPMTSYLNGLSDHMRNNKWSVIGR